MAENTLIDNNNITQLIGCNYLLNTLILVLQVYTIVYFVGCFWYIITEWNYRDHEE